MNKKLNFWVVILAFLFCYSAYGQDRIVTGTITDISGDLLPGVTIRIDETSTGTISDIDGKFSIQIPKGNVALLFSYIGFEEQKIDVTNRTTLNVVMKDETKGLEEVVVVGYGTMKKTDITGSVASISTEKLKGLSITNADEMLKGRMAGVQVTQSSGAPGGASSIRIRGATSINNSNEPLYVIDGIPFSGEGSDIGGFDWAGGSNGQNKVNPLSTIAPSDIVSMDVLKDASATAIYGAAGANGVIIITTRRGEKGSVKVSYDGYMTTQMVAKTLDMMNLSEYAQYQVELGDFIQSVEVDEAYNDPSILGEGTDWQDAIFRTAMMQSHQLSLTGGGENITFAASGGYMKQDGIIFGSGFERYNSRFNIEGTVKEWFKMGSSLAFTHTDEVITRQDGSDGVILQALTMQPSVPVYNFDGTWAGPNDINGASQYNPLWLATMQNNTLIRNRAMGNMYLSLDISKDLNIRSEFGFDLSDNKNKSFIPTYDFGILESEQNKMMQREDHSIYYIWKNYATYNHTFAERHNTSLMAGAEISKSDWDGTRLIKQNFSTDDIFVMTNDGDFVSNNGWKDAASSTSFFGRLNYNYDERYLLTTTFRADASSKFGDNNKWGYFTSAALAWRISNESFLQDLETVSNLKLRLGYGMVGNSNIPTYQYGSAMYAMSSPLGTAYRLANVSNPNIKWEASEQYNLGIDLGLWNNRLNLTLDLYDKSTEDLLMKLSIPSYLGDEDSYSGIAAPFVNIGETQNRGIDISLNTVNVEEQNFNWTSDLIVSINRNKVVALNDDSQIIFGNLDWWAEFQTATAIMVGQPMGVYYGYKVDRLFRDEQDILESPVQIEDPTNTDINIYNQKNGVYVGDIKFQDINDDGVIDDNDQTVIGDPNPDFTFGFSNTFTYKEFELSIGIDGSYGADILNFSRYRIEAMTSIWDNQSKAVADRARVGIDATGAAYLENPRATVPRPATNDDNRNTRMSERWIEDGSYLRISNITLGYNVPSNFVNRIGLSNIRVYMTAQNVYTFTNYSGYDPEIGAFNQSALKQNVDMGRYPSPRSYTLGVNIGF